MNDTNYPKIDEVSDATSYIDDTVKAGTKYYYLVRPVFNDGTAGEYSKPISGVALGKTNLTKIKAKSGKKITLTWKKVSKAEGYLIYRQDSSDSKFYQIVPGSGSSCGSRKGIFRSSIGGCYRRFFGTFVTATGTKGKADTQEHWK